VGVDERSKGAVDTTNISRNTLGQFWANTLLVEAVAMKLEALLVVGRITTDIIPRGRKLG